MNDLMDIEYEVIRRINRKLKKADRFDNYKEISAKFDSVGKCGHEIKKDDRIGWNPSHGCYCPHCWNKWVSENREADLVESGYMNSPW